jgi:hypothetical protein
VQTEGQEASVTIALRRCAVPHGRNEFRSDATPSCGDIYSGPGDVGFAGTVFALEAMVFAFELFARRVAEE